MRFVIVISGWVRLGIRALRLRVDQNKKAASQVFASGVPGTRIT
jgi:hypothetical protein